MPFLKNCVSSNRFHEGNGPVGSIWRRLEYILYDIIFNGGGVKVDNLRGIRMLL